MHDILSFTVKATPVESDEDGSSAYTFLHVTPSINNIPIQCAVFDPSDVIAQHLSTGYFEPFTCSCGVSGCAGIFESAYLFKDNESVQWRFPEEYFRDNLPLTLSTGRDKLVFTFTLAHYQEALQTLINQLQEFYDAEARVTFLVGAYPDEDCFGEPLADVIEHLRDRRSRWLKSHTLREETFGHMVGAEVHAILPEGSILSVHLVQLADHLAYEEIADSGEILGELRDAAFVKFGKQICASNDSGIDMIKRLGPDYFVDQYTYEKVSPEMEALGPEAVDKAIFEQWDNIQWRLVLSNYIGQAT